MTRIKLGKDKAKQSRAILVNRPWRPIGLRDVEAPIFSRIAVLNLLLFMYPQM
jgi:hypothetical protein